MGVYAAIALSVGIGRAAHGYADGVNHSQRLTKPGPSPAGHELKVAIKVRMAEAVAGLAGRRREADKARGGALLRCSIGWRGCPESGGDAIRLLGRVLRTLPRFGDDCFEPRRPVSSGLGAGFA